MLQGFFGGNAFVGVVDEDFAKEGEELLVEIVGGGNNVLGMVRQQGLRGSKGESGGDMREERKWRDRRKKRVER